MYSKYGRAGGGGKGKRETPIFKTTKIMVYNTTMTDNRKTLNYMGIAFLVWLVIIIACFKEMGLVWSV